MRTVKKNEMTCKFCGDQVFWEMVREPDIFWWRAADGTRCLVNGVHQGENDKTRPVGRAVVSS